MQRSNYNELSILNKLYVEGFLRKASSVKLVYWHLPFSGWLKVNIDGSAEGSLSVDGCDGIFRNCQGFVISCFDYPIVHEAKMLVVTTAVDLA